MIKSFKDNNGKLYMSENKYLGKTKLKIRITLYKNIGLQ